MVPGGWGVWVLYGTVNWPQEECRCCMDKLCVQRIAAAFLHNGFKNFVSWISASTYFVPFFFSEID